MAENSPKLILITTLQIHFQEGKITQNNKQQQVQM